MAAPKKDDPVEKPIASIEETAYATDNSSATVTSDSKRIKAKASIKSKSSVKARAGRVFQVYPKEYSKGIIDNSVEPAFDVEKIASVYANHIKNLKDENGQMVGVFGQWGRGKSYFINQVFKQLNSDSEPPFIPVKFQAWKYQNAPSIWAYLFETLIDEYLNVNKRKKYCRILRLSVARNGHWKSWAWPLLLIVIGIFTFSFSSKFIKEVEGQNILKIVSVLGTLGVSLGSWSSIQKKIKKPAATIFNSISKAPSFKEVLGIQAEVQKELKSLVKAWSEIKGTKRILLFVDDLDRCSQEQMIDIIDSLRIMLDDEQITKHVLILVALDEEKLKKAIRFKYKNLYQDEELTTVIDEYMDKLFISAIKLFPITNDDRTEFVKKLVSQINSDVHQEDSTEKQSESTSTSTQASVDSKDIKYLDPVEISLLEHKIKSATKDLTPRQIRILIYRYLLARNLWLNFFRKERFDAEKAISEIMWFSGFNNEDPKTKSRIDSGLSKIARMVVAY